MITAIYTSHHHMVTPHREKAGMISTMVAAHVRWIPMQPTMYRAILWLVCSVSTEAMCPLLLNTVLLIKG